jgi:beta-galactosidase/beta-glucuronidase
MAKNGVKLYVSCLRCLEQFDQVFHGFRAELLAWDFQVHQRWCQVKIKELIQRDKNHSSVIMWNIANEPMVGNPLASYPGELGTQMGVQVLTQRYQQAKAHDPTRPVTLASKISRAECQRLNLGDMAPVTINPEDFANRESEGVLLVRKTGETLYRVKDSA